MAGPSSEHCERSPAALTELQHVLLRHSNELHCGRGRQCRMRQSKKGIEMLLEK